MFIHVLSNTLYADTHMLSCSKSTWTNGVAAQLVLGILETAFLTIFLDGIEVRLRSREVFSKKVKEPREVVLHGQKKARNVPS